MSSLTGRATKYPLARTVGQLSGARLLNVAASFLGAALVSRALGPSDRGIYSLVTTLSGLAVLVFTLGLPTAITWQIARGTSPSPLAKTFVGLTAFAVASGLAGLCILRVFAGNSAYAKVPLVVTCLMVGALTIGALVRSVATGLRDYRMLSRLLSAYAIVTALTTAATAVATGKLQPTLYAMVFSAGVVYGWYLVRLRSLWRSAAPVRAAGSSKERRKFAGLAWIVNMIQQFNFSFGLLTLAAFSSAHEVGLYAAALAIAQVLWLIPSVASEIAFAEAASRSAEDSLSSVHNLSRGYLWGVTTLSAALALAMWPLSYAVVPLALGSEFTGAITPLLILLPGVVCFSIAQIGSNTLAGLGRMKLNLMTSSLSAIVTVVGGFALIPLWGAVGAAATSTGSYLVATMLTLVFLKRLA